MARGRSRQLFVAALIPLWGILAFSGLQRFAGTRYEPAFLVAMALLFAGLFSFVCTHVVRSKRARHHARKGVRP